MYQFIGVMDVTKKKITWNQIAHELYVEYSPVEEEKLLLVMCPAQRLAHFHRITAPCAKCLSLETYVISLQLL